MDFLKFPPDMCKIKKAISNTLVKSNCTPRRGKKKKERERGNGGSQVQSPGRRPQGGCSEALQGKPQPMPILGKGPWVWDLLNKHLSSVQGS